MCARAGRIVAGAPGAEALPWLIDAASTPPRDRQSRDVSSPSPYVSLTLQFSCKAAYSEDGPRTTPHSRAHLGRLVSCNCSLSSSSSPDLPDQLPVGDPSPDIQLTIETQLNTEGFGVKLQDEVAYISAR